MYLTFHSNLPFTSTCILQYLIFMYTLIVLLTDHVCISLHYFIVQNEQTLCFQCSAPCGHGLRVRTVNCTSPEGRVVEDFYCNTTALPLDEDRCYKSCKDVYTSDWYYTPWEDEVRRTFYIHRLQKQHQTLLYS